MPDRVTLEFPRELRRLVDQYRRRGDDTTELMRVAADGLVSAVLDVFDKEGPGWPPLQSREGTILQDTGNLVGSIEPAWNSEEAVAFTDVPYAIFHASDGPRTKIPLRDFTAIDVDAAAEEFATVLVNWITR